ncbi:hypothetical protein A9A72_124766 [Stutzerimonas stutzeri]|jgi:hypothetical protein|uniref:SMODS and SLOG-associating 2TM effector domain-containing protein n=2 Tax=Stutzerimonas stutzeri TaxID=316 RepID=A0A5S5B4Y0_STUST|nr:SLATT domain-containing protein [Stutzerimonas stutzeri]TYP62015.1 hypothetical protein A9A72_124766 [Stutzerimonas stutzeri]
MMRAAPFDGAEAKKEFASHLRSLLQANKDSAGRGVTGSAEGKQITDSMEIVRGLSLDERKEFYRQNRIFDQQRWYDAKAKENRRGARFWTAAGVISYLTAGLLVLARIKFTEWGYWPIDPIIVFASSIIGWVQLKKYSELAAAYQVTGQEIGIIEAVLDEHDDEKTIADFVNDAELAFSREHTMWAARNNS